jgi:hypothetical protein
MGMYTELLLKCDVKNDIPDADKKVLNFLFNNGEEPFLDELPLHKFFIETRWKHIGNSSSYYHIPWATSKYAEDYIFSRSDFKNYRTEIETFLDYLSPLLDTEEGKCIGYWWYEEDNEPTLIFHHK